MSMASMICLLVGSVLSHSAKIHQSALGLANDTGWYESIYRTAADDEQRTTHWSHRLIPELTLRAWHGRRLNLRTLIATKGRLSRAMWGIAIIFTWGASRSHRASRAASDGVQGELR